MRKLLKHLILFSMFCFSDAPTYAAAEQDLSLTLLKILCQVDVQVTDTWDSGHPYNVCDVPRRYPGRAAGDTCPLSMDYAPPRIWRGRFTADHPQILAIYRAECEPHANNFGGAILFRETPQGIEIERYIRGLVLAECVVVQGKNRDQLFCHEYYVGQGNYYSTFGALEIGMRENWQMSAWLEAMDSANYPAVVADEGCKRAAVLKGKLCNFLSIENIALTADHAIAVRATFRDTHGFAAAKKRYEAGDFNAEEQEWRELSSFYKGHPALRDNEYADRKVEIIFRTNGAIQSIVPLD